MQTALIYTRVSGDEQAKEGLSLPAQLAECRRYAAGRGFALGQEYQDVLSGKRDDRPAYQRLLADVRALRQEGQDVTVVVAKLDRLGRRLLERIRSREELKALGVQTHSVREGGVVSDLTANILASVAEEESRLISERIRSTWEHVQANGFAAVHGAPLGYRWRPRTDAERGQGAPAMVLEPDASTAPTVAELFRRVAAGASMRQAAAWVATQPVEARGGRRLCYSTVRHLLVNPVYQPAEARRWPAIVDAETWHAAHERMAQHEKLPAQASKRYLLTGFLKCPHCGSRMAGQSFARKHRYACKERVEDLTKHCTYTASVRPVDASVLEQVGAALAYFVGPDGKARLARAWRELQTPADPTMPKRRRKLVADRDKARKRLADAALLLVDGVLDKAGYDAMAAPIRQELDALEAALVALDAQERPATALPPLDAVLSQMADWMQALGGGDVGRTRDVLALLVERVEPERIGHGRYDAHITWTPLGQALAAAVGI